MKPIKLILSCEHAVNHLPADYASLFHGQEAVLETHRGIDLGALEIANHLHAVFKCSFIKAFATRLLIDCNRSLNHPHCFSEYTKALPENEKKAIIDAYYTPYRHEVETLIKHHINEGNQVFHLSVHSFTPILNQVERNAGIGLLYDSSRHAEKEVARIWRSLLLQQTPTYRVRMNYPYKGKSDGFTSHLRKRYTEHDYLGFEVECNQALLADKAALNEVAFVLSSSLNELLQLL